MEWRGGPVYISLTAFAATARVQYGRLLALRTCFLLIVLDRGEY